MNKNSILLLKTLLLSTSQRNIFKYSTDKKKKKRIVWGYIGTTILYAMLVAFGILICVGYGTYGFIEAAPVMCALVISLLAFLFTFFKTNGYLFNFKEYDMLMSLPFSSSTVAACKFLYMYLKSLPWYLSISLSMMIGYGIYAHPNFLIYPLWIILAFFLPVIPMLIAAFLGFLVARISAGFRKTNIIQTVLTMLIVILGFSLRFIIEGVFKNNKVEETLKKASDFTENASGIYFPARWFSDSVTKGNVLSALLLVATSALIFALVFFIVGRSYRNINSALKSHAASKNYKMSGQKQRSVRQAIVFKEFKRMTGSTTYMTNAGVGPILAVLIGIVTLVAGFGRIVGLVVHDVNFDIGMLQPAIPFVIYFFIGMLATTACSPSLEGKNYWILQSLPVEKKTIYQGKMLFNMYLTVPAMALSTLCMCISAKVPVTDMVLYLVLGFALCCFSTAWGCVCGIKHMRLDWENEVEVIKQGSAVTIYLLPNMLVVMGLVVLVVFLGTRLDHKLLALIFILIAGLLAGLSYRWVMSMCRTGD